jgi:transposase InsO family protein
VADITYVRLLEEFAFLAVLLDAFSRKVIGWALETHLEVTLLLAALEMAIKARKPAPGTLIHHSDRGVRYACREYTAVLAASLVAADIEDVDIETHQLPREFGQVIQIHAATPHRAGVQTPPKDESYLRQRST